MTTDQVRRKYDGEMLLLRQSRLPEPTYDSWLEQQLTVLNQSVGDAIIGLSMVAYIVGQNHWSDTLKENVSAMLKLTADGLRAHYTKTRVEVNT